MPSVAKSQALILRTTKYGDSGLVVHAFDSVVGRCGFFLRGAGRGRNASAAAVFHPLAVVDLVSSTSGGGMPCIREFSPALHLASLRCDVKKGAMALFISEVLYRSLHENQPDTALFTFLTGIVGALDAAGCNAADADRPGADEAGLAQPPSVILSASEDSANPDAPHPGATGSGCANLHLWFLTRYAVMTGFRPTDNFGPDAPLFDPVRAMFIHPLQAGDNTFSQEESLLLHNLLNLSVEEALLLPLSGGRRSRFAKRMIDYLSLRFEIRLDIKSLDILHEVFN